MNGTDSPAGLLELSAERDAHLQLRHAAYREGWMAGSQDEWSRGYAEGVGAVKAAQHELVNAVRLGVRRLVPSGDAWAAAVARHGGTEYGGAGRPRVPVSPAVVEVARGSRMGRAA